MIPTLILGNETARQAAIRRLTALNLDQEPPWGIWIAPYEKIRSLEMNAVYWVKVGKICDATGHSKNVIHTLLKKEAWGMELAEVGGKVIEAVKSSAKANRGDFSELILHADDLATQLGVDL